MIMSRVKITALLFLFVFMFEHRSMALGFGNRYPGASLVLIAAGLSATIVSIRYACSPSVDNGPKVVSGSEFFWTQICPAVLMVTGLGSAFIAASKL